MRQVIISRLSIGTALVLVLVIAGARRNPGQAQPQPGSTSMCLPGDQKTTLLIGVLTDWVTATDPQKISDRDNIFHIPVVPPANISVVTNTQTCTKAAQAYASMVQNPIPNPVYVIQMVNGNSTWYLVTDPAYNPKGSEFGSFIIFDKRWKDYGGWTG